MTLHRLALPVVLLALGAVAPAGAEDEASPTVLPIINGIPSAGFPAVGALAQFGRGCTATLIGCQTALTAAHCICDLLPAARCMAEPELLDAPRFLLLQHAGIVAVASVDVDPAYSFPHNDLAVLHLTEPVAGIAPSPINTAQKPAIGAPGTIVGFGMASDAFYGVKRVGKVRLARCTEPGISQADHDCWLFDRPLGLPGSNSTTCFGDSGGPLYTTTPAGLAIAGVHSAAGSDDPRDECKAPQRAIDADVYVRRSWIASVAGDLGTASCGGLPAAGTPAAPVLSQAVTFTAQKRTSRMRFTVAPGTAVLRVALNAYGNASSYELYVNHGASAGPSAFVCKATTGYRSFKYCEVESPAAGTWSTVALMTTGFGGNVQQTVTRYLSASGPR